MVMKGLPSTYNKDLQEDKVKMFETASTLLGILQVAAGAVGTLKVWNVIKWMSFLVRKWTYIVYTRVSFICWWYRPEKHSKKLFNKEQNIIVHKNTLL